jgi:hypothetical protein
MSDVVMLRYAPATGNPAVETGGAFDALARVSGSTEGWPIWL